MDTQYHINRGRTVFILPPAWLLASLTLAGALLFKPDAAPVIGMIAYGLFAVALTVHLAHSIHPITAFAGNEFFRSAPGTFSGRLAIIGIGSACMIALSLILREGAILVIGSAIVALWLMVKHRLEFKVDQLILGGIIGLCCGLATFMIGPRDVFLTSLYTLTVPILFVAGNLLLTQTGLTQVWMLQGRSRQALKSFIWAGIVSAPLILLNLFSGVSPTEGGINHWWQPFYAFAPALAEEIWARLFLVTLIYAWLQPVSGDHPGRAFGSSVFLAALIHGLAHYPESSIFSAILSGLFVGVPLGMLFVKRDLESAIGYHFFPVFIRWVIIFLQV